MSPTADRSAAGDDALSATDDVPVDQADAPTRSAEGRWALGVRRFALDSGAPAAAGYTLDGRRATGPQQGFGQLWRRTYTAVVVDSPVPPDEVMTAWRSRFGDFWPKGNRFYGSAMGIEPGEVASISVDTHAGVQLSTGVLVMYADDESFTFMTPEGHMFAGWITFSVLPATGQELRATTLKIEVLLRPSDPLFHLAWPIMRRMETAAWQVTLRNVAREVCGCDVEVVERSELLDRRLLWQNWRNIRYNAGIRSAWWSTGGRVLTRVRAR